MREFSIREGVHEHKSETGHITDLGLTFTHSCEKTNKQALFLTIVAASLDLVPAVTFSSFCVWFLLRARWVGVITSVLVFAWSKLPKSDGKYYLPLRTSVTSFSFDQ